jgi:hypothetical protein
MMPCFIYALTQSLCHFASQSLKCLKCIHYKVLCDGNFSREDFDKLFEEKDHLKVA